MDSYTTEELNTLLSDFDGSTQDRQKKFLDEAYPEDKGSIQDMENVQMERIGLRGTLDDKWFKYVEGLNKSSKADLLSSSFYGAGAYTVGSYATDNYTIPTLVADFANDRYIPYSSSGLKFDDLFDYTSENSTATMVDSDGKMKWAPHNVLKDSNDFSSSTWDNKPYVVLTANATTAPDGTNTGWKMTNDASNAFLGQGFSWRPRYNDYKFTVFCKYLDNQWVRLMENDTTRAVWFDIQNGVVGTNGSNVTSSSIEDVGNGWYKCSFEVYDSFSAPQFFIIAADGDGSSTETDGNSIYIWGAHAHISSLGGMVDNPDEPVSYLKSYIPTGSSTPTSKPRRNHHAYNGYSWVNQGILIESKDQRTNLIYPSNDCDDSPASDWAVSALSIASSQGTGPDGEQSLQRLRANTNDTLHAVTFDSVNTTEEQTFSCFVKAVATSTVNHVGIRLHAAESHSLAVIFDVRTGQKTDDNVLGDAVLSNYGFEDWGDGLYRIWVTGNIGSSRNVQNVRLFLSDSATPTFSTFNAVTFAGANNDTTAVYAGFFQLETAELSGKIPYPSSYIPTIAGTVSRGEEILAVGWEKLGPYPTAELTGSNIVTSDPDDWTVDASSNSITAAGNGFDMVDDSQSSMKVSQSVTTVNDKLYEFSFRITDDVASYVSIYAATTSFGTDLGAAELISHTALRQYQDGIVKVYFTSTGTTTHLTLQVFGTTGGIRDIQCKEVTSIGFAADIKGMFSYHDNGATFENVFLGRDATDADARAVIYNNTSSTATGRIYARTNSDESGSAISGTSDTYFSSGSNIPMSFSGVFGYKSVSVGIDGEGKTVDTGDVIFPNVLYDDLSLSYSADGTISQVRYFRNAPLDFVKSWGADATKPSEEPSMSLTFEAVDDRSFVDTGWRVY